MGQRAEDLMRKASGYVRPCDSTCPASPSRPSLILSHAEDQLKKETDRDRETDREIHTETHRETQRESDRDTETDRQTETQRERKAHHHNEVVRVSSSCPSFLAVTDTI